MPRISPPNSLYLQMADAIDGISQDIEMSTFPVQSYRPRQPFEEALLFGYLSQAKNDARLLSLAVDRLNDQLDSISNRTLSLLGGLSGVGWTIEYIQRLIAEDGDDNAEETSDLSGDIDQFIITQLSASETWNTQYDLVSGLVGCGLYLLERLPRPSAIHALSLLLNHLERLALTESAGVTWFTKPELLPAWQRKLIPGGYYNLGVAHGIPGILYFLNELVGARFEQSRCRNLLDGAISWFINKAKGGASSAHYSSWISGADAKPEEGGFHLAWCYGDLGIIPILLQIARRTRLPEVRNLAMRMLDGCLMCQNELSGINDAPFCHGAVGAAHIFNRLYAYSGDSRCIEKSEFWYSQTIAMRRAGYGIGGFRTRTKPDPEGPVVWQASSAFLDGSIGIALALQAGLSAIDPCWDRQLCLSGRNWTTVHGYAD